MCSSGTRAVKSAWLSQWIHRVNAGAPGRREREERTTASQGPGPHETPGCVALPAPQPPACSDLKAASRRDCGAFGEAAWDGTEAQGNSAAPAWGRPRGLLHLPPGSAVQVSLAGGTFFACVAELPHAVRETVATPSRSRALTGSGEMPARRCRLRTVHQQSIEISANRAQPV